ncbi:hydroxymethylbilane synthase, partial [Acinetobacter baumannii]
MNDRGTELASAAERAFLKFFGTGCSMPVAAFASVEGDIVGLDGLVASPDGKFLLRDSISGPAVEAIALGEQLASRLC